MVNRDGVEGEWKSLYASWKPEDEFRSSAGKNACASVCTHARQHTDTHQGVGSSFFSLASFLQHFPSQDQLAANSIPFFT